MRNSTSLKDEVSDSRGPTTIRDAGPLSFDEVRATVEGIATELAQVWQKVQPSETSVAFGLPTRGYALLSWARREDGDS